VDPYKLEKRIKKALSGNRQAQKDLYDVYRVYLLGVASLYANSKEEAEDILLEGFYRIFKDLKSYDSRGNFRAWARKVVVNSKIDFRAETRAQSILTLVRTLPEPQRIIFSLKGIEGYSYKEISQKLGIKEVTLRSHYIRARKRLQHILQNELDY